MWKWALSWAQYRRRDNNLPSNQFAHLCHHHRGQSLAMTVRICHQYSCYIRHPNPFLDTEPFCPNLVHQEFGSREPWNWKLISRDLVSFSLAFQMSIHQPDHLITALLTRFVFDCIDNLVQYWTSIMRIEDLITILHVLLNLPCTSVCFLFSLYNHFQLCQGRSGKWAHSPVLLKFITMFCISQTSKHWNKYILVEYNQFYLFD